MWHLMRSNFKGFINSSGKWKPSWNVNRLTRQKLSNMNHGTTWFPAFGRQPKHIPIWTIITSLKKDTALMENEYSLITTQDLVTYDVADRDTCGCEKKV